MIKIKASPKKGFWRAGVFHPHGWTEYPDGHFTEAQLEAIEAEPMLTVVHVDDEPEAAPEPDPKAEEPAPEPDPEPEAAPEPGDSGGDETPKLESFLADGTTPRCQHVSDNGNQCRRGAAEDSLWCESHLDDHQEKVEG